MPQTDRDTGGQARSRQHTGRHHAVTPIGKFAELLVLGLIVGAFSFAASFLWKGHVYRASDLIQYFTADLLPQLAPDRLPERFPPMALIDIGEATCFEWAQDYRNICAALPRFPHDELSKVFLRLAGSEPKLVVVDIDLSTEARSLRSGPDPFNQDIVLTRGEKEIREAVLTMRNSAFLVAQPLIRQPKDGDPKHYDYAAVRTILHNLDKPNLRFGQVEQTVDDDGVERRFPASLPIVNSDPILNPHSEDSPKRVRHLAVRVCELITDDTLCGRRDEKPAEAGRVSTAPSSLPRFGSRPVSHGDLIQFPFSFSQDVVSSGIKYIEARAVLAASFDPSVLTGAICHPWINGSRPRRLSFDSARRPWGRDGRRDRRRQSGHRSAREQTAGVIIALDRNHRKGHTHCHIDGAGFLGVLVLVS